MNRRHFTIAALAAAVAAAATPAWARLTYDPDTNRWVDVPDVVRAPNRMHYTPIPRTVVPYDTNDDAIAFINAKPRPLALYCFTHNHAERDDHRIGR